MNTACTAPLDAEWLRTICLEAGADDVGFVEIGRPALAGERPYIEKAFPAARTLISVVKRMNRENIRSPMRSLANSEFHHAADDAEEAGRAIAARLEREGVRALCPPAGFPMEAGNWGMDRMWVVSHKPVAVAAGMGRMGIHRNVIHPKFGNFILLETVLIDAEVTKAYVQTFAEALHVELAPKGVDVLSSAPGPVESGFAARADMKMGAAEKPETVARATVNALGKKMTVTPGALSKLLTWSLMGAPRGLRVRIMGKIMGGMTKHLYEKTRK